ncbi:hypothetical protein ACMFMG_004652 [Clarireedia jacksonii]
MFSPPREYYFTEYWEGKEQKNENIGEDQSSSSQLLLSEPSMSVSNDVPSSSTESLRCHPISTSTTCDMGNLEQCEDVEQYEDVEQNPGDMQNSCNNIDTDNLTYSQSQVGPSLFGDVAESSRDANFQFTIRRTEIREIHQLSQKMLLCMSNEVELPNRVYPNGRQFDSGYDPVIGTHTVKQLWRASYQPVRRPYTRKEHQGEVAACERFDHVDLYRIIYVTMVLRYTVYNFDEAFLSKLAAILTRAGRPHGYENTLLCRMPQRSGKRIYTVAELRALFNILGNRKSPGRDRPFNRVLAWANEYPNTSEKLLADLPTAIMGELPKGDELLWDCCPLSFIYEIDSASGLWYREDYIPPKQKRIRRSTKPAQSATLSAQHATLSAQHATSSSSAPI